MKTLVAFLGALLLATPASAQQATWWWWGPDQNHLAPVSAANPLPVTGAGGGGSGTVTSVTFTGDGVVDSATPSSAVTTSGTLTATIKTQTANTVLAGPVSGGALASAFRALVPLDLGGSPASHATLIDVAGTPTWKVVPDCTDTGGNHLNYTQSSDAFSCGTSGGGGSVSLTAATANIVVTPDPITGTGTIGTTEAGRDASGSGVAIVTADNTKTVQLGAFTYTLAQAGTTGFASGWGTCLLNVGATAATVTTTTSVFKGAGGATSLTIPSGSFACPVSDGTDYVTTSGLGLALTGTSGHKLGFLDGANTYSASQTFGETHGTTYAPTLTSNNYDALTTDCGKTLLFPTGTTPTLTLPNLNASCTIVVVQNSATQFTVQAASGGSVVSVNSYTKSKAQNALLFLTIITPSASAAKWALAGDGA